MKKRLLRLSKKILILTLCTTLISGSVFSKYKITANAAAMALSSYGAYEICLFIAECFLAAAGTAVAGEAIYQNRDALAELGKEVIDSCSFDDAPDWVIVKATAAGQQQVFGREVFDYIRAMTLASVLAGGSSPENNNNDDDDDEPETTPDTNPDAPTAEELYEARSGELGEMALMATGGFLATLATAFAPLIEGFRNGDEDFLPSGFIDNGDSESLENLLFNYFGSSDYSFDGSLSPDSFGYYYYNFYSETWTTSYVQQMTEKRSVKEYKTNDRICGFLYERVSNITYPTSEVIVIKQGATVKLPYYSCFYNLDGSLNRSLNSSTWIFPYTVYHANFPVFATEQQAKDYLNNGTLEGCLNVSKTYQIADWLQEDWSSALNTLHGGIHSLTSNSAIVGEAANQAFQNQLDGKGYIDALDGAVTQTAPLPLPGTMQDPVYFPEDSTAPKLDPGTFPWASPSPVPDPVPDPGGDGNITDEIIHGKDTFGLNTLFGSLILLIMILIMLLLIFLSCLAFIIMIFRIPAQTGFLPEEMIAGLDYIKTLEIPGFGMSVYAFFMALIYILLIFTVIGILRKNIDKIKFPRKGRRS